MTHVPKTNGASPTVSLLIPVYNVERYLAHCLDSVCAQSFGDFEALCINDGSTDGSRAVVEDYVARDARFRLVDKPNSGYGATMNRGLSEAQGMYVAILESDDFFEPDALELLVGAASHNNTEVAKANFWLYWSKPRERRELFEVVPPALAGRVVDPWEDTLMFYEKPSIWSGLYRRDFIAQNGIAFTETPGASFQDAGFHFKVWASARRVACIAEPVLSYRQDNLSSSVNSPGKAFCVCDEYEAIDAFLEGRPEAKAALAPIKAKMRYDSYRWNYERLAPELRPSFVERFSQDLAKEAADGSLDWGLLEPWKRDDLRLILDDPLAFHEQHKTGARRENVVRKTLHYLRRHGVGGLAHAARRRLRHMRG
ncbi:MAG: glycosyltransferase [Coriobacteriales bacterium]|jgi:hypothetical protein|nr:glycosyltransferase [Coriobacteriales bacterium]